MGRNRTWMALAAAATLGLPGCSFPDVTYSNGADADGGADATSDATSTEAGVDATVEAGTDASTDASSESDAPVADAPLLDAPAEATGFDALADVVDEYVFEAAADAPKCDQDQDLDLAKGGACGSTDCDDLDPRAYTGEPDFLTFAPTPVTQGDWNCDGVVTPQFPINFSCGLLNLGSCGTAAGFSDAPTCGQTSPNFTRCKTAAGALCVTDTTTSNTQGCK